MIALLSATNDDIETEQRLQTSVVTLVLTGVGVEDEMWRGYRRGIENAGCGNSRTAVLYRNDWFTFEQLIDVQL